MFHETPGIGATILPAKTIQSPKCQGGFLNCSSVVCSSAPEERLSVLQALELFTRNPAYIGFEEKEKGSLEIGKLPDFIVIDRDILVVPSEQLKDVHVLQTWVGGELVYEKH